jgi:ornithine cyclodeaminase/alanine dehydrogenase-like protein (mu-crystallin family)
VELSAGRASVPPRVAAMTPDGLLAAMPGSVRGVLETKLVAVFPGNDALGLPTHQALIALFDERTGTPLCVMDGTYITAARTGAASAVATRALARENARVLAVLGAGVQGRSHVEAVTRVRDFAEVRVASRMGARAEALAADLDARAVASFEDAVRGADVVCCCTDSAEPVLRRDWLAPGAHVTSVGAAGGGPELDRETVTAGLIVVESRVAFQPYPAGAHELQGLEPDEAAELGEVLAGTRPGRTSDDQVTVYKSMGHAVEDAAAARLVLERARAEGVGVELELTAPTAFQSGARRS